MRTVFVQTSNALKFGEIAEMAKLYGCKVEQVGSGFEPSELGTDDALVSEQTRLEAFPDGRVAHESQVLATTAAGSKVWKERVKGSLRAALGPSGPDVYGWDELFVPAGSSKSLHELKLAGLKVSARQLAVGAWLKDWLEYGEPVRWNHIPPAQSVKEWALSEPLLSQAPLAESLKAFLRVHQGGAWFKEATNRRAKHYWWPGLNAGIPQVPKRDRIHETTFLVHDLFHWTMPDAMLSGRGERPHRTYVALRMMSEAVTMVMADMAFVEQAAEAGLEYDFGARRIFPIYDPAKGTKAWCKAMSVYAVLGDESELSKLCSKPEALAAFNDKYGPFFEEDLRWTAHNARHLASALDPRWVGCHRRFALGCDLGLSETDDYAAQWSDDDRSLVDGLFEALWARHWVAGSEYDQAIDPEVRALQRWFCGQLALTYKMDDLPLSRCVRESVEAACLGGDLDSIRAQIPLWENYVDALEALSRLSGNDAALFKDYYPIVPPMYVSYDRPKESYSGIAARWVEARNPKHEGPAGG